MSENPFTEICERLNRIEALLEQPKIIPIEKSDLITDIDEACRVLGGDETPYSRQWMYMHTSNGDVPHMKNGNRLVFSRSELETYRTARIASKQYRDEVVSQAIAASADKKFRR
jgi:hypothetical protein